MKDRSQMEKDRIETILLDLIHSHCQNCDGQSPLIVSQDEINLSQARSQIIEVMRGMVPKEWDVEKDFPIAPAFRNVECPDKGDLQIWCHGVNHAIQQINEQIERLGSGE